MALQPNTHHTGLQRGTFKPPPLLYNFNDTFNSSCPEDSTDLLWSFWRSSTSSCTWWGKTRSLHHLKAQTVNKDPLDCCLAAVQGPTSPLLSVSKENSDSASFQEETGCWLAVRWCYIEASCWACFRFPISPHSFQREICRSGQISISLSNSGLIRCPFYSTRVTVDFHWVFRTDCDR